MMRSILKRDLPKRAAIAVVALVAVASVVMGRERPAVTPIEPAARIDTRLEVAEDLDLDKLARPDSGLAGADPFAQRSFAPAGPTREAAPASSGAPPLPFKYVGKMIDAGKLSVFISRGEQNYSVASGQSIDAEYRVDKVSERSVTFTFLPLKTKQELLIPVVNP
jgi:hypothetical protein